VAEEVFGRAMKMKYLLDDNELKSNWERCLCGNYAEMKEICQGTFYDSDDDGYFYSVHAHKVLKCPSCNKVSVIRYLAYGNDLEEEPRTKNSPPKLHEFTREILHTTYKKEIQEVPESIVDVFNQAQAVISSSPRASFILCGAALEEICRAHAIPTVSKKENGKERRLDLYERLEQLFRVRGLSDGVQKILHGIRELRNVGAHGSQEVFDNVTETEAAMLLSLLDYVLERLYVDDARAKNAQSTLDKLSSLLEVKR
jgi:Domain of unknown function (DUF4145)